MYNHIYIYIYINISIQSRWPANMDIEAARIHT